MIEHNRPERKLSIRLKTSAGIETWFSSTQPRLRSSVDPSPEKLDATSGWDEYTGSWLDNGLGPGQLLPLPQTFRQRSRWKWVAVLYCCLSIFLLSGRLLSMFSSRAFPQQHAAVSSESRHTIPFAMFAKQTQAIRQQVSPLQSLQSDHLITKLTSIYPGPLALRPHVLRATADASSITACLWAQDKDIALLPTWASRWKGNFKSYFNLCSCRLHI
jgi:hypothetical protein